jgi:hypothetical protein
MRVEAGVANQILWKNQPIDRHLGRPIAVMATLPRKRFAFLLAPFFCAKVDFGWSALATRRAPLLSTSMGMMR